MQNIELSQEWMDALNKFAEACDEVAKKVVEVLEPIVKKIGEVFKKLWDMTWQVYRDAGMPYGETDDGFLKWWKEMCIVARTRESLERDLAWRATLNSIRHARTS